MDTDIDGNLTADETAAKSGFDLHWDEGDANNTFAILGTVLLELSGPSD